VKNTTNPRLPESAAPEIAMFTPTSYGGQARYTKVVLSALVSLGGPLQYSLITRTNLSSEFETDEYQIEKVLPALKMRSEFANPLHWLASRSVQYLHRAYMLLNWARNKPALKIIHFQEINTYFDLLPLIVLKHVFGLKLVMTVHNVVPHRYTKFVPRLLVDILNRRIYHLMDHLFVHSDDLARQLAAKYSIPLRCVAAVPHGVWSANEDLASPAQQENGVVLFFGEIRRNKGLHNLLAAAHHSKCIKKIIVAGRTDDAPYYRESLQSIELVRQRGIEVELIEGYIPEAAVASIFGRAQLVALLYENFVAQSGVIFDAIAYQRPVIATPVGALGELMQETEIGTLAPSLEPQRLAQCIDETLGLAQSGQYQDALSSARLRYSWNQQAVLLQQRYLKLLGINQTSHAGNQ
jgi:glycosyltransferase involved in cell wall biosynthesis